MLRRPCDDDDRINPTAPRYTYIPSEGEDEEVTAQDSSSRIVCVHLVNEI